MKSLPSVSFCIGNEYTFAPSVRTALCLSDFSDEEIVTCYDAFVKNLPHSKLCTSDIRALLLKLYVTEPPELEVKLFLEELTRVATPHPLSPLLDKTALYVDRAGFLTCISAVRARIENLDPTAAAEHNSYVELMRRKVKGDTMAHAPQTKYRVPVTTAQEHGWHTPLPHEAIDRKPKNSCAETQFAAEMIKSGQY